MVRSSMERSSMFEVPYILRLCLSSSSSAASFRSVRLFCVNGRWSFTLSTGPQIRVQNWMNTFRPIPVFKDTSVGTPIPRKRSPGKEDSG